MSLASLIRPTAARRIPIARYRSVFSFPTTRRTMASIPTTMKGISVPKIGGVDVLQYLTDLLVPQPKEGEVLIKNDFIGVNFIDTYFRTGVYPSPSFPYIPGREGAGTVISVGPAGSTPIPAGLKPNARAVYYGTSSFAEYTVAPIAQTYVLPDDSKVDNKTAAAAILQGLTAITLVEESHHVNKGDWILVHAAAGGMGLWLCQLLKAIGAHTIGTASTPEKRELAKKNGAEVVLEYPEALGADAFVAKVKELTGGEGVAAVFDGVGKATFDVSLDVVKRKGSLISFGNASGAPAPFTIARLAKGNVRLMRPSLFGYVTTAEEFQHYAKDLFGYLEKGELVVNVHDVYDLKDAAKAQTELEGRKTTGKVLLKP